MNPRLSWHLCKRDLTGPLKPWIFAWLGVCLLHLGMRLWQTLGGLSLEWLETRWRFDFILVLVTAALIVPRLIHEESWVDGPATWRARPLAKRTVLLARMMFIILVLVFVPALMELCYFTVCGYGARTPEFLLAWFEVTAMWLLPLIALAVMTRSYRNFATLLLGLLIGAIVVYLALWWRGKLQGMPFHFAPLWHALQFAIIGFVTFAVVVVQLRWRRPFLSCGLVILGMASVGRVTFFPNRPLEPPVSNYPRVDAGFTAHVVPLATEQPLEAGSLCFALTPLASSDGRWMDPYVADGELVLGNKKQHIGFGRPFTLSNGPGWLTRDMAETVDPEPPSLHGSRRNFGYLGGGIEQWFVGSSSYLSLRAIPPGRSPVAAVKASIGMALRVPEVLAEFRPSPGLVWREGSSSIRLLSVDRGPDRDSDRREVTFTFLHESNASVEEFTANQDGLRSPFACSLIDATLGLAVGIPSELTDDRRGRPPSSYDPSRRIMTRRVTATLRHASALGDWKWLADPGRKLLLLDSKIVGIAEVQVEAPYVYWRRAHFSDPAAVELLTYDPESRESVRRYAIDLVNRLPRLGLNASHPITAAIIEKLRSLGEQHVGLLLDLALDCGRGEHDRGESGIVFHAVAPMITEEHKDAVLRCLVPGLKFDALPVVARMGWEDEALPLMVERATAVSKLPRDWAKLMLDSRSPQTFDLLVKHIARGDFGYDPKVFDRLKPIPGFPHERLLELTGKYRTLLGEARVHDDQKL